MVPPRTSRSPHLFLVLIVSIFLCFSIAWRAFAAPSSFEPAWGTLSASDARWQGGDGAFTIPLGDDRRVWLFGDTWLSSEEGHLSLVANTIGIQRGPCHGHLKTFWREGHGGPGPFFLPSSGKGWLWPAGGTMVGKELYLFFHHLVRRHPGGPWDFLPLETEILRIGNPNVPPPDWTLERGSLPWRGEALLLGGSPQIVGGHLWAFATRPTGTHRELVAARISLEDVRAFRMDRWAFLMKDGTLPRWTARPEKALGLFQGVGTEFTVAQDVTGNGWLCLYSPGGISPEIHLRWAPRLGGPWGPPTVLYRCPEEERDPEVFCYGAKLHPECAAGDLKGLWITYTVNTRHGNPPPAGQSRPRWVWIPIPFSD